MSIFWVLRTLRYKWCSCEKLRKYRKKSPGKGLCPLHSRDPFKKGSILNFLCRTPIHNGRDSAGSSVLAKGYSTDS